MSNCVGAKLGQVGCGSGVGWRSGIGWGFNVAGVLGFAWDADVADGTGVGCAASAGCASGFLSLRPDAAGLEQRKCRVVSKYYFDYHSCIMRRKERLTVTVDAELVQAGNRAVRAGRAESLSRWVNDALAEREAKERRLQAMADAVAAYEAEFGPIAPEELAVQQRADEKQAVVVRGRRRTRPRSRGHGRKAA